MVIYTTNSCAKCIMLKNILTLRKKEFEVRDLEDENVLTELVLNGVLLRTAPILYINGKYLTNFDEILKEIN